MDAFDTPVDPEREAIDEIAFTGQDEPTAADLSGAPTYRIASTRQREDQLWEDAGMSNPHANR